jgi:hypothetical protein
MIVLSNEDDKSGDAAASGQEPEGHRASTTAFSKPRRTTINRRDHRDHRDRRAQKFWTQAL